MNPSRHAALPPTADAPPSIAMDRAAAFMRDMRAEYDAAVSENKAFAGFRRDFQAKFEEQLHELQAVERSLADLEATHNKLRNDAENEIALLKSQLAHVHHQSAHHQSSTTPHHVQDDQNLKDQPPSGPDNSPPNPPVSNPPTNLPRPANGIPASSPTAPSSSSLPGPPGPPIASSPLPPASSNPSSMDLATPHRPPHQPHISSIHSIPPSDPSARPLPSRLPTPLTSMPARTHPAAQDPNPHPSAAYHAGLPSAFVVSRPMYQPPHPGLASQPHALPPHHPQQYHSQPHPDPPALAHHSKFPRLVAPPHPHHMQLGAHASTPLPSPGSLAAAPSSIPSMMSNGPPNDPRSGVGPPHEVQPMGIMGNGPQQQQQQQQDDRMMAAKGRARVPPPRGAPHNSMLASSRGPSSAVTPPGRPRHAGMPPMDEQSRGVSSGSDWEVLPGRAADGSVVNMNLHLQHSLPHDSVVCCVRYSWDGRFLATGSNRSAHIFDATTGQPVAKFVDPRPDEDEAGQAADSYVRAVCFSPNGEWLVTGAEDHVVKIWDVRNRVVKHRLAGHGTDIYSVDASANGRFIISGSGDKKAKLWNLDNGTLLSTLGGDFGPSDGITSVSVSPTSQHVAAGSLDKIVRVWDVETSRLVRQFEGHKDSVYSVAFSPDGRMLLSGSLDKSLKLWDLAASQPSSQCRLTFTGHSDFVLSVAFSPSGRWLISGSKDRTVQFWDPRQSTMCQLLRGHKNSVISIAHNPATKFLATGSGDCRARTWMYDY